MHIVHIRSHIIHFILYYFAYFAYWFYLHIKHIMHIKLHIACIFFYIFCCIFSILAGMHILHILTYIAYYLHIYLHIIVHILHTDFIYILCILCILNCILHAYFYTYSVAYLAYWQECIFYIFWHMLHIIFIFNCIFTRPALFIAAIAWSPIPGPRCSRTTTYNHHHCSVFIAESTRKVSRFSSHGKLATVSPTGTRGRWPNMEDNGITYKTCTCSRRS